MGKLLSLLLAAPGLLRTAAAILTTAAGVASVVPELPVGQGDLSKAAIYTSALSLVRAGIRAYNEYRKKK